MDARLGHWAFIVGVLIAVIAGLVPAWNTPTVMWILVILGLIVGLLNITAKETVEFLVATIALVLIGTAGIQTLPALGTIVTAILENIVAFVAPAALVVALKAIYELARK
ncbi:hypothetical protein KY338_06155 [Candidatus Woesearchaeota archaeon]|nr:hypothetical protein [Candidatus Woesearchaeota archaeon]MBW3005850.1 hypothetical protein [Candidatus Woesearchaeota archaeon]